MLWAFIACHTTITVPEVADLLWTHVTKHFGLPQVIVSDRDPKSLSTFWRSLANHYRTMLAMSSATHPETDGQTEVLNQHLEFMLQAYVNSPCDNWDQYLDVLMFAYNNSCHSTTKDTQAALLFGYEPRGPLDLLFTKSSNVTTEDRAHAFVRHREMAEAAI